MSKSTAEQIQEQLTLLDQAEVSPDPDNKEAYAVVTRAGVQLRKIISDVASPKEYLTLEFIRCCSLLRKYKDALWTADAESAGVLFKGADARKSAVFKHKIDTLSKLFLMLYREDHVDWKIELSDNWESLEIYCLYTLPPELLATWLSEDEVARKYFVDNPALVKEFLSYMSDDKVEHIYRAEYTVILLHHSFSPALWQLSLGHPAAMEALISDRETCLSVLAQPDFDPAYHNLRGRNFMHYVLLHVNKLSYIEDMFKTCPGLQAQLNEQDYRKDTPLHYAINSRVYIPAIIAMLPALLAYEEFDLTRQNSLGNTPLMEAVMLQDPDLVRYLLPYALRHHLDPGLTSRNIFGQTALEMMLGQDDDGKDWADLRNMLDPNYQQFLGMHRADIARKQYYFECCESLHTVQRISCKTIALLFEACGYEQGFVVKSFEDLAVILPGIKQQSIEENRCISLYLVIQIDIGHYAVLFLDIHGEEMKAAFFDPSLYRRDMLEWSGVLADLFPGQERNIYNNSEKIQHDSKSCTIMAITNALNGRELREKYGLFEHLAEHSQRIQEGVNLVEAGGFPAPIYLSCQSMRFFNRKNPLPVVSEEVAPGVTLKQQVATKYTDFSGKRQKPVNVFSRKETEEKFTVLHPFVTAKPTEELKAVIAKRKFTDRLSAKPSSSYKSDVKSSREDDSSDREL